MSQPAQLTNRLIESIRKHRLIISGDAVGIGVSGGADSIALALLLCEAQDALGIRLVILHMNHCLRGDEADADARFVRDLAQAHGLESVFVEKNVQEYARPNRLNLEDAGRKLRYEFFDEQVAAGKVTRVAVAHTADDQAETVLAKLIRGTGPTGLAAIYPVAGHVVRPLLGVRRAELREYLAAKGQAWREDSTNADESRLRARIRTRLLPLLESEFQPSIVSNLSSLSAMAREDEEYWQDTVEREFEECVRREGQELIIEDGALRSTPGGNTVPPAMATRVIRRIATELAGCQHGLTREHVEKVLGLLQSDSSGARLELPAGIGVKRGRGVLIFDRRLNRAPELCRPANSDWQEFSIEILLEKNAATSLEIPHIRRRVRLKTVDWVSARSETNSYAIDWDLLKSPLVLRNWRPGDAYRPQGFLRSQKIKRLLQGRHIPSPERIGWPILESAGAIAWASNFPVAHRFAPNEKTRTGVLISEESL
ncbi:MAG TPA: tRNA lysidine(34) synthetase TilS [Candidatus Acidoferrales bacterium]|nr:tRNA lysidine(34) synthetase TilS [Candidatus Acidoferrales bacterium]